MKDGEVSVSNSKYDNTVSFLKRKLLYTFCCNTGLPVAKSNFVKIGFRIILKITALNAVMVGAYITAEKIHNRIIYV